MPVAEAKDYTRSEWLNGLTDQYPYDVPCVFEGTSDATEPARMCEESGYRAIVLKNHFYMPSLFVATNIVPG
jgi:hypothetical protein